MKNINTLKELREEQRKLKLQAEVSKQLFFESLAETRTNATDFALKKMLLPAGAAGAAIWGAKKIFGNDEDEGTETGGNGQSVLAAMLPKLLPLGISLVNAYFAKQTAEETGAV